MQCNYKDHVKCNCGIRVRERFEDPLLLALKMEREPQTKNTESLKDPEKARQ